MVYLSPETEKVRGQEFYELSLTEKQGIYDLERWKGQLIEHNSKLILAAFLVQKFSQIDISGKTPQDIKFCERDVEVIFQRLGFNFIKERVDNTSHFTTHYIFGKKEIPVTAKKYLVQVSGEPSDISKFHTEFGFLMGIPETAVISFVKGNTFKSNSVSSEPYSEEVKRFKWFGISKNNWEQEAKTVSEFARKVRSVSPALYDVILNDQ